MTPRHPCSAHIESCQSVQAAGGDTAARLRVAIEQDGAALPSRSLLRLIEVDVLVRLQAGLTASVLDPARPVIEVTVIEEYEEEESHADASRIEER